MHEHRGRKAGERGRVGDDLAHLRRHLAHLGEHRSCEGSQAGIDDSDPQELAQDKVRDRHRGIKVVGEIPQVAHTYSYVNTGYPSLNEKQVGIGETTFTGPDTLINKDAPLLIEELCRLAMERAATAREAVKVMGALAEEYGYGDGGECLTVSDPKEVWQFEIVGVGKHKVGAAWAAQRIPDGHVGISANIPRIGKIDRSDTENFMASDNLEQVAIDNGLWDGNGDFVFWKVIVCSYAQGRNYRERSSESLICWLRRSV